MIIEGERASVLGVCLVVRRGGKRFHKQKVKCFLFMLGLFVRVAFVMAAYHCPIIRKIPLFGELLITITTIGNTDIDQHYFTLNSLKCGQHWAGGDVQTSLLIYRTISVKVKPFSCSCTLNSGRSFWWM